MNAPEDLGSHGRSTVDGAAKALCGRPRVVIFEGEGETVVEVLELPESVVPGTFFCHCGTDWKVTATRTGCRVLIARPANA